MKDDDYTVETGDEFDVIARRKGPREAPPPAPAHDDEPEAPAAPAPQAEDAVWALGSLPDPPEEPMRLDPPPPEQIAPDPQPRRPPTMAAARARPAAAAPPEPIAPPSSPTPIAARRDTASHSHEETGESSMQIAIAATEFNYDITSMMLERAHEHARFLGAEVTHVVRVPGVYDLPFAVKRLMKRGDVDGVVTLGCVIEGETDHDDLVIQHATRKIIDLSLEHDKPVGLGITGPGMSRLQAMARIDRAKEAVEAAVRLHRDLEGL